MSEYARFPLTMVHPGYQAATSRQLENGDWQGTPARLPPITVNTEQEEAYAASQGYEPAGHVDPSAWVRSQASAPPPDYQPVEYPKWVNGKLVSSPSEEDGLTAQTPMVQGDEAALRARIEQLQDQLRNIDKPKRNYTRKAKPETEPDPIIVEATLE